MDNMTSVIEDAVNDSALGNMTEVEDSPEVTDTTTETPEVIAAPDVAAETETPTEEADPSAEVSTSPEDDAFAKRFGIPARSVTGRENRVPHSRVKKIVEKNERETIARVTKELEEKYNPQVLEYGTKVKDYEDRLQRVAQFEQIMESQPQTFLEGLAQMPAYKPFFDYVAQLAAKETPAPVPQPSGLDAKTMPQPDQVLSDGSRVYSMEGLAARDEWLAQQIETRAMQKAEARMTERYGPIEQDWQRQKHLAQVLPVIDKQIADARTWPQFTENEAEIVKALQADRTLSLDGAYRRVVVPKIYVDKNQVRSEVLAEMKRQPIATAAPVSPAQPRQVVTEGKRRLEDVIKAELDKIR